MDVLESFDARIRPYFESLITKDPSFGFQEQMRIVDPCSGFDLEADCDRCKILVPYAQQHLTWEIIFDLSNAKEPPDVIFDPVDEDFYPSIGAIHSFACWDWTNRDSLLAMVTELLQHYRDYQLERASGSNILQKHIRSFLKENPQNYQISIDRMDRGLGSTTVVLELDVDLSGLPPSISQEITDKGSAILLITIPYPESSNINSQLYLSPNVEKIFGGSHNLRIPVFPPNLLLGDYVTKVKQLLKKQVQTIMTGFEKRKDYIAAFLSHFGKSVLEYDAENFSNIILLLEWNDFYFTFTVELPLYFPSEHPVFIFKSVYHNHNRKPYTERHTSFPYSPRWDGNEMAKRANAYILDEAIKSFQLASVKNADN